MQIGQRALHRLPHRQNQAGQHVHAPPPPAACCGVLPRRGSLLIGALPQGLRLRRTQPRIPERGQYEISAPDSRAASASRSSFCAKCQLCVTPWQGIRRQCTELRPQTGHDHAGFIRSGPWTGT